MEKKNEFKRGVVHAWGHAASFVKGMAWAGTGDHREKLLEVANALESQANEYAALWEGRI